MGFPNSKRMEELFSAIISIENMDECEAFFEDLCTINELQSMAQRLEIARALSKGDSYQTAMLKTGASSATVGRVNRCLSYGAGGYGLVLKRLEGGEL